MKLIENDKQEMKKMIIIMKLKNDSINERLILMIMKKK